MEDLKLALADAPRVLAQESLKAEYFLWQLYQIEQDMRVLRSDTSVQKQALNEAGRALHAREKAVEEARKAAGDVGKQRLLLERRFKKRKADLEKKVGIRAMPLL